MFCTDCGHKNADGAKFCTGCGAGFEDAEPPQPAPATTRANAQPVQDGKIDMWIISNQKFFPAEKMALIRDRLAQMTDSKLNLLYGIQLKDPTTILLMSIFFGEFGVDRFMLGHTGLGIAKLLTFGGCLIWWLVDLFIIQNKAREENFNKLMLITG